MHTHSLFLSLAHSLFQLQIYIHIYVYIYIWNQDANMHFHWMLVCSVFMHEHFRVLQKHSKGKHIVPIYSVHSFALIFSAIIEKFFGVLCCAHASFCHDVWFPFCLLLSSPVLNFRIICGKIERKLSTATVALLLSSSIIHFFYLSAMCMDYQV